MKNMEKVFFSTMAIAFVCGVAVLILAQWPEAPRNTTQPVISVHEIEPLRAGGEPPSPAPVLEPPPRAGEAPHPDLPPQGGKPTPVVVKADNKSPKTGTAASQSGRRPKEPPKDPLARVALAYVGADWDAEAYWYDAINDPDLPANERQDLIEDLNEDGLTDPKHPTMEDLPLIFSRLLLIEMLAPEAMDKVNADAFAEAYKDLVNLANVAMGGGEPVR